ncbi:MAG: hypothetical protein SGILL_004507 [Bacillariaceae sp.]
MTDAGFSYDEEPTDKVTHEDSFFDGSFSDCGDEDDGSSGNASTVNSSDGDQSTKAGSVTAQWEGVRSVKTARCCFLFLLLVAAGALAGVVYRVTSSEETQDFQAQFQNYGEEVISASNDNVIKAFEALETLSVTVTSFVKEQADNGYPTGFVKVPDTEHHFVKAKENANAYVIGFMPHISRKDYWLWHEFSTKNQDWIAEANAAHGIDDPRFHDNTTLFYPYIHDYEFFDANGEEVELSYDIATCSKPEADQEVSLAEISESIVETRHVPVEPKDYSEDYYVPVWQLTPPPHPDGGMGLGNFNLMFDPLFEQNFRDSQIVGTLSAVISWNFFFQDILVQGSEPVHAVFVNKCGNKKFTFLIEGNEAVFLGDDIDAHDPKYNSMGLSTSFADFAYSKEYLAGIDGDPCTYTLTVYPTQQMEDSYTSNEPLVYAMVVLGVFLCTALAFFMFDFLVHRHQKILSATAARQSALVASLFPKKIHMKLLAEAEEAAKQQRLTMGKAGLRKFLTESSDVIKCPDEKSKPIADLFPNTTVMFADISGK